MKLVNCAHYKKHSTAIFIAVACSLSISACANLQKGKAPDPLITNSTSAKDPDALVITVDKALDKPSTKKSNNKSTVKLGDVIKTSLETNPGVLIAVAQADEARLGIKIAKASYMPILDVSAQIGKETTSTGKTDAQNADRQEVNVQLRQNIFDFGGTNFAVERRETLYQSAKNRKKDVSEQLALDITKAYMNFLKQSELTNLAAKNIAVHEEIARIVRLNEEGGNSTVADVKRVETRLDAARNAKLNSDNALKDAATAFKRLTDYEPTSIKRPKNIIPKFAKPLPGVTDQFVRENPKLRSLALDVDSLKQQVSSQNREQLPKIYGLAEANYKKNVGGDSNLAMDYRVMVGVSWRIFDGGKRAAGVEQVQARIREADARYKKLYRELSENLDNNNQQLKSSKEKLKFLSRSAQSARKVMTLYKQQFEAGEKTAFEILDAQRDLFNAQKDTKNHKYETAIAYYRDLRIKGKLIEKLRNSL